MKIIRTVSSLAITLCIVACDGSSQDSTPTAEAANGEPVTDTPSSDSPNRRLIAESRDIPEINARSGSGFTWSDYFGSTSMNDHLTILVDDVIQLDVCNVEFATLLVAGQLIINDSLSSCGEVVMGAQTIAISGSTARVAIGSNANPFDGKFRLSLKGDAFGPTRDGVEQRMLMVRDGAALEIYGASAAKRSWTSLDGTVRRGDTTIVLAQDSQWETGDVIVIAASNVDPREAEMRVIVATDGRTLTLNEPLKFDHFGEQQILDGRMLDSRAEVGLLSHNVIIEGDETSELTAQGASIVIVGNSILRPLADEPLTRVEIEGLELRHVGQSARPERYGFMWYFVGDGRNHFFRNSAIHHGYQRSISVVDTDDVTVENVVSYDIQSHAFVPSERGNEVRNTFRRNLAVLTRREFAHQQFSYPANIVGQSEQAEHRASAFWLRNTFNFLEGNRAAGVLGGHGFYYAPINEQADIAAYQASGTDRICAFDDNLAHSLFSVLDESALNSENASGFGLFMDHPGTLLRRSPELASHCVFDGLSVYKAQSGGVWLQNNTTLKRTVIADSQAGVVGGDVLDDVVVMGQSDNALNSYALPADETDRATSYAHPAFSLGGFLQLPETARSSSSKRFNTLSCINLTACFVSVGNEVGEVNQYRGAIIDNVRLVDTPQGFIEQSRRALFADGDMPDWGRFTDVDGSLTGVPDETRSLGHPDFFDIRQPVTGIHGWEWDPSVTSL